MRKNTARDEAIALIAKCSRLDSLSVEMALTSFQSTEVPAYQTIRFKKKSGKYRIIHAPCEPLKLVQAGLLKFFYRYPVDKRMFGFVPGKTQLDNARQHLLVPLIYCHDPDKCFPDRHLPRWIITLDLKDAFPSVKTELVKEIYQKLLERQKLIGYKGWSETEADLVYEEFITLLVRLTTWRRRLPQGAPTSPYLLNLALCHTGTIEKIHQLCSDPIKSLQYSIYVDDLTISSYKAKISDRFIRKLTAVIEEGGIFRVNRDKTNRNSMKYKAHQVTGVVLTEGSDGRPQLTLSQKTLKSWRGRIHRLRCQLEKLGDNYQPTTELEQVLGYINWIKTVYLGRELPASIRKEIYLFELALRQLKKQKRELYYKELRILHEFLLLLAQTKNLPKDQ
jgi:RNA-directed DNA polymerase